MAIAAKARAGAGAMELSTKAAATILRPFLQWLRPGVTGNFKSKRGT